MIALLLILAAIPSDGTSPNGAPLEARTKTGHQYQPQTNPRHYVTQVHSVITAWSTDTLLPLTPFVSSWQSTRIRNVQLDVSRSTESVPLNPSKCRIGLARSTGHDVILANEKVPLEPKLSDFQRLQLDDVRCEYLTACCDRCRATWSAVSKPPHFLCFFIWRKSLNSEWIH